MGNIKWMKVALVTLVIGVMLIGYGGSCNTVSSGSSGKTKWTQTSNPSYGDDRARSIIADSNYLYIAGSDFNGGDPHSTSYVEWRIEKRLKNNGTLVTSFGINGVILYTGNCSIAHAITADNDYLYIAGYDCSPGNEQWRIEKRNKTTGALIPAFSNTGTAGVVVSNPSTGTDIAYSITADNDYLYIGGEDHSPNPSSINSQWRIEKRDKMTGALVTAFGAGGVVTSDLSSGSDQIFSIIADNYYIYIAGFDSITVDYEWRIEKRDKTTGALIPAFSNTGTAGVAVSNPSTGTDVAYSITADNGSLYIAGHDATPQWRIEKRNKTTGTLDANFGTNGVILSPAVSAVATSIIADSNYLYIAGSDFSVGSDTKWRIEKRDKTTGGQ
jgi:hypothetical protein